MTVPAPFTPFLKLVADELRRTYANDFSQLCIVFPNKRAALFFDEYLQTDTTCWAPRYCTITELFRSLSPLQPGNDIDMVCRIYEIYKRLSDTPESLDSFYGWGERLLGDFDEIDKSMADADRLLQNVTDYKDIDFGDYLTPEQRAAVERFFDLQTAGNGEGGVRETFRRMWQYLLPIYKELRAELQDEGLAYAGMLSRGVVEALQKGAGGLALRAKKYVFIGFNALERVEQKLFDYLQEIGRALFFWDYDVIYVEGDAAGEAGVFIRENLRRYPSPLSETCFREMQKPKKMEFVAAATENAQAYAIHPWLEANLTEDPKRTAVVLCNEELLEPVLHAIPDGVGLVNITKGFPLMHTPPYAEIGRYLDERMKENAAATTAERLRALLAFIEKRARTEQSEAVESADTESVALQGSSDSLSFASMMRQLYAESWFLSYGVIGQMLVVADAGRLELEAATLCRLVRKVLSMQSVPFHGEPLGGLQVMGLLETRCLDFENVLILSANEGKLPRTVVENSFIPFPLRAAYGLPLPSRRTAVFGYYFFRVLQRAKQVRIFYNDFTNPLQPSEMSRFMRQLLLSGSFDVKHLKLTSRLGQYVSPRVEIEKPANIFDLLNPVVEDSGEKRILPLSPSSINAYLDCPLKFYYQRIARLHVCEPDADDIRSNTFGNVFHETAELYYKQYEGMGSLNFKEINGRVLAEREGDTLRECLAQAYARLEMRPDVIVSETVLKYMQNLLRADAALESLKIIGNEIDSEVSIRVNVQGEEREFAIGGRIDRLDVATRFGTDAEAARTLRILDYKTGVREHFAKDVGELFDAARANRPYYLFQTLLYALSESERVEMRCGERLPVSAALFYPAHAARADYDPWIKLGRQKEPLHEIAPELLADFRKHLQRLVGEILDLKKPFVPTTRKEACRHCDFANLCAGAARLAEAGNRGE